MTAGEALRMDEEEFRNTFRKSAIKRAKYEGWRRNALNLRGEEEEK